MFGSRAREDFKRFSDYDLGLYSSTELEFSEYSKLLNIVAEFKESALEEVELVNLNNADKQFLLNISSDLKFVGGSYKSWSKLLTKLKRLE